MMSLKKNIMVRNVEQILVEYNQRSILSYDHFPYCFMIDMNQAFMKHKTVYVKVFYMRKQF